MKLVLLPPGEFDMGSSQEEVDRFLAEARQQKTDFEWQVREAPTEVPKRRIRITTPCYFGKCEVTMGQFAQFVAATGYVTFAERVANGEVQAGPDGVWRRGDTWRKSGENWIGGQTQNHPVIIVTWNDADAFCQWLSSKENRSYRIPTEAEWEYACRAGTATRFPSGEAVASISGYAHMRIGAGDTGFLPVGRCVPTPSACMICWAMLRNCVRSLRRNQIHRQHRLSLLTPRNRQALDSCGKRVWAFRLISTYFWVGQVRSSEWERWFPRDSGDH